MKMIDLNWSELRGQGNVKYSKEFDNSPWITKLDLLQDCLADLTAKYNSLMTESEKEKTQ